jgi:hypothetical protein
VQIHPVIERKGGKVDLGALSTETEAVVMEDSVQAGIDEARRDLGLPALNPELEALPLEKEVAEAHTVEKETAPVATKEVK